MQGDGRSSAAVLSEDFLPENFEIANYYCPLNK
jgi:hypothetical protein